MIQREDKKEEKEEVQDKDDDREHQHLQVKREHSGGGEEIRHDEKDYICDKPPHLFSHTEGYFII